MGTVTLQNLGLGISAGKGLLEQAVWEVRGIEEQNIVVNDYEGKKKKVKLLADSKTPYFTESDI